MDIRGLPPLTAAFSRSVAVSREMLGQARDFEVPFVHAVGRAVPESAEGVIPMVGPPVGIHLYCVTNDLFAAS